MKVCIIAPAVVSAVSGGLRTQILSTAFCLEQQGVTVTLFDQWKQYDWKSFDCVHVYRADFDTITIARWLWQSQIPFVTTPVFYHPSRHWKLRMVIRFCKLSNRLFHGATADVLCCRTICNYSSRVLPNTEEEKKFLIGGIGVSPTKIQCIPNGVDERFSKATEALFVSKFGIKDFILSVGTFGLRRKNLFSLLKALETIDHPAVIIGTLFHDDYSNACRRLIQANKNILFIEGLSHDDPLLASAYAACKVFALPSLLETPGLAALEAGLAGASIVITPFGGPKNYFLDMADYVHPTNIKQMRDSIIEGLNRPKTTALREHILTHYTWPTIANQTMQIYASIAKKQSSVSNG
ncbi:MAG: glycosyltransferase [Chitinivibrionales bacterium]|nr:glycosyltransferase [Chitinivibrionales bacterium]